MLYLIRINITPEAKYVYIWKQIFFGSLSSSCLLSRNVKVKMFKTLILHLFCMGVKLGLSC
jgi:hypothetical protein